VVSIIFYFPNSLHPTRNLPCPSITWTRIPWHKFGSQGQIQSDPRVGDPKSIDLKSGDPGPHYLTGATEFRWNVDTLPCSDFGFHQRTGYVHAPPRASESLPAFTLAISPVSACAVLRWLGLHSPPPADPCYSFISPACAAHARALLISRSCHRHASLEVPRPVIIAPWRPCFFSATPRLPLSSALDSCTPCNQHVKRIRI
jgi:hypothetical protein